MGKKLQNPWDRDCGHREKDGYCGIIKESYCFPAYQFSDTPKSEITKQSCKNICMSDPDIINFLKQFFQIVILIYLAAKKKHKEIIFKFFYRNV